MQSKKIIIGVIVILLLAGGGVLFKKQQDKIAVQEKKDNTIKIFSSLPFRNNGIGLAPSEGARLALEEAHYKA